MMHYGNEFIGLYVDKTYGYYYALNLLFLGIMVSGNELNGHTIELSVFKFNVTFSIRLGE